jgi:hypothetical protein
MEAEDWVFTGNTKRIWQYIPKKYLAEQAEQQETE